MEVIENYQEQLTIPIPVFPPFKLRSSLIDKDPVIWEYLLADYIELFKKLLALVPFTQAEKKKKLPAPFVLTVKTTTQLQTFIQTFLHESSIEATQVFSLGAINPTIRENQHILKLAVFSYIKAVNLVNLKITGSTLWDFCKVYVSMADKYASQGINQALVTIPNIKRLIDGSIKSSYTSKSDDVSLIRSMQDHLGKVIAGGKWKQEEFDILYLLLGQRTKKSSTGQNANKKNVSKNIRVNKKKDSGSGLSTDSGEFAKLFVDKHWIEILQELYVGGTGIYADLCVKVMVMSLCSLNSPKILRLLKDELEVDGLLRLRTVYPLVSCVVLSKTFNELNPDLKNMLSPLLLQKRVSGKELKIEPVRRFDDAHIAHIRDMFPQISIGQAKTLLVVRNDDVESVINKLLEMSFEEIEIIEDYDVQQEIKESRRKNKSTKKGNNKEIEFEDQGKRYTVQLGKKEISEDLDEDANDEELRKKNLERALAMLYEPDEDEPDDTYIDNERTENVREGGSGAEDKKTSEVEAKLFGIYTSQRDKLSRDDRKTPFRDQLRKETGWSDEQIEGWARMLDKSSSRFRLFEEKYIYVDGSLNKGRGLGKTSTKWARRKVDDDSHDDGVLSSGSKRNTKILLVPDGSRGNVNDNGNGSTPKTKNNGNFKAYMVKKQQQKASQSNKK